jgi:hypothetical protein
MSKTLTTVELKALLATGMTLDEVSRLQTAGFSYDDLLEVGTSQKAARATGGLTNDALVQLIEGQRKAANPSNNYHAGISAFSYPEGDRARPKPALDRETYFCGAKQQEEQLMPSEIDAFNALQESRLIEKPNGPWECEVTAKRRMVTLPVASRDQLMDLPNSLILILRELANGSEAVDPVRMAKRIQELESRLEAAGA